MNAFRGRIVEGSCYLARTDYRTIAGDWRSELVVYGHRLARKNRGELICEYKPGVCEPVVMDYADIVRIADGRLPDFQDRLPASQAAPMLRLDPWGLGTIEGSQAPLGAYA